MICFKVIVFVPVFVFVFVPVFVIVFVIVHFAFSNELRFERW